MDNSFSTQESQIVRRQSSLGGNNIKRTVTELEGNTALVWAKVTQVYYQKGTCDFTLLGGNTLLNDNSGSNGTYSAPIPVDYYGTNYQGKPFIKTRLVKEGNKVLVAFVDGKLANPVIVGVYPDNTEGYEYLAPAYTNKILDENEDTNNQVNNMLEVEPSNQIIYQSGNGDFAKSMQGKSFLIVQGSEQYALNDLLTNYDSLPYFYLDEESNDINSQKVPLYSVNEDAPEWLLVHESNNGTDTHRTRFYVNKKGELQIVFFDVNNPSELLVIDGSKDSGFTVNKRFDGDGNLDSDSKDYVKFNVGQDHKISMEVASAKESKAQSQKLELKDDGLYYNGKSLLSYLDNIDSSVNDDDVKDIINSTTGVDNWDDFRDKVHQAAQDAQKAADEAKEAGDDADRAGEEAAQAGLDAKLAGENAAAKVDSMRDKLMYYLNLSPEKDLYVPGKYLILNEDITIRSGFIKEGYIDDAAINSAAIKNAAITSAKIKDLAVYSAKIANAAITNAKISKLAVGTAQIRDLAVTDEKVGKLTFNHMVGETLDANLIKVTNLEADSIKAHSITADKLFVGSLGEISGNLGNITGGHIDGSKVDIDGLPSDDPDMLTPEKKAQLRATVDTLQLAVNAQVDFQNSVGAPSNVCDTLKANMAKLVSDTTPLLRDMFSTEPYDHNLINTDIDNVNIELNNIQHRAITTIGKTADGKNTIYTGAFVPDNPKRGDIWAKPSVDGSNEGTFEIYGENGWFSPTAESQRQMQEQIDRMPKNYYQSDQPTGDIVEGSMWYKPSYDALGNVTFTMYVYHNGAWKAMTDANIEGINAEIHQIAQTANGKNAVFASDSAPSNPAQGDIWIDTSANNAIKVYINGSWQTTENQNQNVQDQVNSALNGIPKVYYQSTQPTGNIIEGSTWYKTGDNNTYIMYTYKNGQWVGLLDDNIDTAIDNTMNSLQQAGANLVVNSDFSQGTYGWALPSDGSAKVSDDLFKGHKYVTINKSNQSGTPFFWISQKDRFKVTPGEKLSYSAWIKHTGLNPNGALLNIDWYADATSGRNGWQSTYANSTNDSDWEFYKVEDITVPSNAQYANFAFTLPANGTVSYALPMLVHGSTVPSWAPSPADSASVSDVQGIDFGGRNLLLQSQARDNGAYYLINGTKQNETFLGANVYEQHSTWQGQEFKLQNLVDRNVINTNDEYVFSTYVKYTGKNPGSMIYFFNADNTIQILNGENGQTAFANTKPNVWNQISIHIKFNSLTPPSSGKFYAGFEYGSNNDHSVTTYWACPKLEKGSKATDYSVAPEDVDSSLSANQNAINQTNNKVGQVQNSVNTANNNISSLQGNVNTINQQLKDQQNQIKGATTVNYVPNSPFVTDPQSGLAQTSQKPLLWKEFGNAQMRIADWGGQPSFMHFYNDWGAHSVRLDLDYADCIINGWVDRSTGDTKSSSGDVNGLINRLITVVPGDTLHLENDNVDQLSTGNNYIAWYDQRANYLCTTRIPGMSSNSAYVQDVIVPYKACYAKIGMVGIPKGTKNTWGITYKFKNMAGWSTITNNPTENSSHWSKVGSGSGTVTQVNNLSGAPRGTNSGMQLVTTWNNYQNTGMRTNLTGLTRGKVYMISFYAFASNGGGSIRMVTPDQSSIQIIPNTQTWYPIEFSFIASDTNQWLDLYTDAPNKTITITCINVSGCDSNADRLSPIVNNWSFSNVYQHGSTVTLSSSVMGDEGLLVLAHGGSGTNYFGYNQDLIENRVYVAKMYARSKSGNPVLHLEQRGAFKSLDVTTNSTSWTYVEFPFVFNSSTSCKSYVRDGSLRKLYMWNKDTTNDIVISHFNIYDYDSDVPKEGYFEDNRYGQIDASSAVYGATSAQDAYVRVWRNGTPKYYPATSRGTTVTEFDDTLNYVSQKAFDTYDTNNCTDLVNYLNGLNSTHIVAITTCDSNTLDSNFQTWLENHNIPINLIQSYNQQRVRMAFVGPIDRSRSSWVFPTQFALEGNYTKYQPNTFGGTVTARLRHNQTGSSKYYKFHTYPVTPKSWVEFTWRDTPDFDNVVFFNNGTGLIGNIGSNVPNLKTVSMYALDQEAFTLTGSSWSNIGAYVEPFDVAPHVSTATIPVVTSTHSSRVQASGSAAYSNQQAVYLEVGHDSTFDKSTKVLFNGSGTNNYSLQNYLVDGMSDDLGWAKPIRITYTLPVTGAAFNNNNSGITYVNNTATEMRPVVNADQMLTITQSTIDYIPTYQPNTSGLVNNSVQINQSYNGVTIDDKDGITINAGNNRISLNANVGIDIYGNRQHNMKLDTNGNLIMRGNLVAGNISGVTFSGNAMQLQTGLAISGNGAITVGNDVSISASQGLIMNKGSININNNTLIKDDGTLIAKSAVISGTVTSNDVNITGGHLHLMNGNNVGLDVNSNGNASFGGNLNAVNGSMNNMNLTGTLVVNGKISAANNNVQITQDGISISNGNLTLGNGNGTTFMALSDGTLTINNASVTGQITAKKIVVASNADDELINVNGNFTVSKYGNVYANNIHLKQGNNNTPTLEGVNIVGAGLKLGDTYWNEYYQKNISRTNYDSYGLQTGSTFKGVTITNVSRMNHSDGVREHYNQSIMPDLVLNGYLDVNGDHQPHTSSSDIYTQNYWLLVGGNEKLHIKLDNKGNWTYFNNSGTRQVQFYDSNFNPIGGGNCSINGTTGQWDNISVPSNAVYAKFAAYVGNNNAHNAIMDKAFGKMTAGRHSVYNTPYNNFIFWQGDCNYGYSYITNNYGGSDKSKYGNPNYCTDNNNKQMLWIDTSQLQDGDVVMIKATINYDVEKQAPGTQYWISVNHKSFNDSSRYMGSTNSQYAIVGEYEYTWFFTYHSDLGSGVTFDLNVNHMYYGSRAYVTDCYEYIHPTNTSDSRYSQLQGYYGGKITTHATNTMMDSVGKLRQSYDKIMHNSPDYSDIALTTMRDISINNGYITLQEQNVKYNSNSDYDDFSAVYISGRGIAFAGSGNYSTTDDFMYHEINENGSVLSFWGGMTHEDLVENNYDFGLGTGISFNAYGNINMMYGSTDWRIFNYNGGIVFTISNDPVNGQLNMGTAYYTNVPGRATDSYSTWRGGDSPIKFEYSNGHITLGRFWMSSFGCENQANSDVDINRACGDMGWFRFNGYGIATADGTIHSTSLKEIKYDINVIDSNKAQKAVMNTDFAMYHLKEMHNKADGYQCGVVIDKGNDYSVSPDFVDDRGNTVNLTNIVATLGALVKQQQQQISELNMQVAYLSTQLNK